MEVFFKFYMWADKYKSVVITLFFVLSLVLGLWVYIAYYHFGFARALNYTFCLFAVDVKTPSEIVDAFGDINATAVKEAGEWSRVYYVSLLAKLTVALTIFLLFIRRMLSWLYRYIVIKRGGHTIVVGLGRNSRFFINSMLEHEKHKMIVFEKSKENHYIEHYRNKRLALVKEDVETMIDDLNINEARNIFISTGDDEINIYLAMKLRIQLEENSKNLKNFIVHIEDRTLRNLYGDKKALHSKNVNLRPFSFYKEASRQLFKEHALEGDDCEIMNSETAYGILIVGNSDLTVSLISEACRLSNLPKENRLTIYCIGSNMEALKKNVYYAFPNIDALRHVTIEYIESDSRSQEFYKQDVWRTENLTHIIYAEDSVIENVRISTKVSDVTYVREKKNIAKTKFHIGTMNHVKTAEEINKEFKDSNVFTFAQADKICSRKNLLFNGVDEVAKMIHYAYESSHYREHKGKITKEAVDRFWRDASVNDKRTSLAQAIHINTKLKALGLKRKRVIENVTLFKEKRLSTLFRKNVKMLNSKLKDDMEFFGLTKHKLHEMEEAYKTRKNGVADGYFFPEEYKTNFERVLRMEHNRWMTILILMDNILDDEAKNLESDERKLLKKHHLLKPFDKFESNEEKIYIINDIHAIKNIARYLALTGYEIEEF